LHSQFFSRFGVIGGNVAGGVLGLDPDLDTTRTLRIGGDVTGAHIEGARNFSVGGSFIDSSIIASETVHIHGSMSGGSIGAFGSGLYTFKESGLYEIIPDDGSGGGSTQVPILVEVELPVAYPPRHVSIDGSMSDAAAIMGKTIGRVAVGGDLLDASITAETRIEAISVNGSVLGQIAAVGDDTHGKPGSIGSIFIARDLGTADATLPRAGSIVAQHGAIGAVIIAGDVIGGGATHTGWVSADRGIGGLLVGGDVRGGAGLFSGTVQADHGKIGVIQIAGEIQPGRAIGSGLVISAGKRVVISS
jgi:hypothetical protein